MLTLSSRISSSGLRRKTTQYESIRCMATLKAISIRLKSVKNIQKITQSMKMVSAAKFARAERDLKAARPIGEGSKKFYDMAEVGKKLEEPTSRATEGKSGSYLCIAVSSDRGLCGAIHSSVARKIRSNLLEFGEKIKIVCIGDKSRSIIARSHPQNILFACSEVGRLPPTFLDASRIITEIMSSGYEYDSGKIIYNRFRSVVSYATDEMPLFRIETVLEAPKKDIYEDLLEELDDEDEKMLSYVEFSMACMLFYAMKESACSEQSARMTAMDNASKNAGEMIDKLTLTFNRTRQAVITRELIEIISGASAL